MSSTVVPHRSDPAVREGSSWPAGDGSGPRPAWSRVHSADNWDATPRGIEREPQRWGPAPSRRTLTRKEGIKHYLSVMVAERIAAKPSA
jgi:hypothetical protein